MTELRDEPPKSLEDPTEILLQQLSYYRATALTKLGGLRDDQLTARHELLRLEEPGRL